MVLVVFIVMVVETLVVKVVVVLVVVVGNKDKYRSQCEISSLRIGDKIACVVCMGSIVYKAQLVHAVQ